MVDHPISPEVSVAIAKASPLLPPAGRAHLDPETRAALEAKELREATARADSLRANQTKQWNRESAIDSLKLIARNNERYFTSKDAAFAGHIIYMAWNNGLCGAAVRDKATGVQFVAENTGLPYDSVKSGFAEAKARLRAGGHIVDD
jgi:hypothetical protein